MESRVTYVCMTSAVQFLELKLEIRLLPAGMVIYQRILPVPMHIFLRCVCPLAYNFVVVYVKHNKYNTYVKIHVSEKVSEVNHNRYFDRRSSPARRGCAKSSPWKTS